MISITGKASNSQRGFTYILALIAVAITTISSATAYMSSKYTVKRALEEEILFEGMAYYHAIKSYYLARTPHRYPRKLTELEKDSRYLFKRHIRKLYDLNGKKASWHTLLNEKGNIIGVYLDSGKQPLKKTGFVKEFAQFDKAASYRDWKFVYLPNISK